MVKSLPVSAHWAREFVLNGIGAIEKQYERGGEGYIVSTGIRTLDSKMDGGLRAGEMIVIAGRPCMGKTALALNIAEHAAIDSRLPVVIFALDASATYLAQRLLCSRAKVDFKQMREGRLSERDIRHFGEAATHLAASPLLIDEAAALTTQELGQRMRYYVQAHGVKLAVIDYLQLLRPGIGRARPDRRAGIAAVSDDIRSLARELKIPVLVLCPMNRKLEHRSNHRPLLGDLRGSRLIAQDADVVILLFREEYYVYTGPERRNARGKATLIIAKQTQGAAGDVTLRFNEKFGRFQEPGSRMMETDEQA